MRKERAAATSDGQRHQRTGTAKCGAAAAAAAQSSEKKGFSIAIVAKLIVAGPACKGVLGRKLHPAPPP
jgi:hypothetical protein